MSERSSLAILITHSVINRYVGVGIAIIVVVCAIMITPLVYSDHYLSYDEKQKVELERLQIEYELKEPREGGPPDVDLVDFVKLAQDELDSLYEELSVQKLIIDETITSIKEQNVTIQREEIKIALAQEKIQEEWNAPPIDDTQLLLEHVILNDLNDELTVQLFQKDLTVKDIELKELLQEIQIHDAKLIGVKLSNNCIASNIIGGTCPTYEDLFTLDSSNQEVSGGFSTYDGYFHREQSKFVDSYRFYDTEDTIRIIVDPHQELSTRIKMITIESNVGLYSNEYNEYLVDGMRVLNKDRIIEKCYFATISAENWKMLLPDTIFAFRNGCNTMEIDDVVKYKMPHTVIDKSTSPNVQHQEWLKETKNNCKELC